MDKFIRTLFLTFLFILPLSTFESWVVRPLIVPIQILWIFAPLVLALTFIRYGKIKYDTLLFLVVAYFIYEIARDLQSAPILKAIFGDVRGVMLSVSTSLSLMFLFISARQFAEDDEMRKNIFITMGISVSIASFLALLQINGYFGAPPAPSRGFGTLYNALELAGTALLILIPSIGLYFKKSITKAERYILLSIISMLSIGIIVSGSKIAIALSALLFVGLLVKLIINKQRTLAPVAILAVLLVSMTVFGIKSTTDLFNQETPNSGALGSSISGRKAIWKNAMTMWLANPVTGWGQADFPNISTKFVAQAKSGVDKSALTTFDVHNFILDALVKGGIIKLLFILAAIFIVIKKVVLNKISSTFDGVLITSIAFFLIFLLFDLTYLVSRVYFIVILGLISFKGSKELSFTHSIFGRILKISIVLLLLTSSVTFSYFGAKRIYAEIIGSQGINVQGTNINEGLRLSKKAINIFPYEVDYYSRLGGAFLWKYRNSNNIDDLSNAKKNYQLGLNLSPNDVLIRNKLFKIQAKLGNPSLNLDI